MHKQLLWKIPTREKQLFLSFDDGPTTALTPFILEQLAIYNAKATFFCVGENVQKHPQLVERILSQGHAIGNHTHNHLKGWTTPLDLYTDNVKKADEYIGSQLFRPPYGRITRPQIDALKDRYTIVMWSVLSGDFDISITPQQSLKNLMRSRAGDIVVMHDNVKAKEKLYHNLPFFLKHYTEKGYSFLPLLPLNRS